MKRKLNMNLRCEYSEAELNERRDELVGVILAEHEVQNRKSDANKAFKEQIEQLTSRRDVLAHQIRSKGELRSVECVVEMHVPEVGTKRFVRLDTGEFVKDEAMTHDDLQDDLFTPSDLEKLTEIPDERQPDEPPADAAEEAGA